MPPKRATLSSQASTAKRARQAPRKPYGPFGPFSTSEKTLKGLTRVEAIALNEERISEALHELAGPPPAVHRHSRVHKMSRPILCLGKTGDPRNAGRWFQMCTVKRELAWPDCRYPKWITDTPIDAEVLFDTDIPGRYFKIREELNMTDNGFSTRQDEPEEEEITEPRPFPELSPLGDTSDQVRSSSQQLKSPSSPPSNDMIPDNLPLNTSVGVTLMAWTKDNGPCIHCTVYPNIDGRVRLSEFKMALGTRGIEQGNSIEVYHFGKECWLPALWDTPLPIPSRDHVLLIRYAGVRQIKNFELYLPWVSDQSPVMLTPPSTGSRKGKERAIY
ncbi:hypothetical protein CVT26_003268 [Gymnopilus dilepis]|uniref:Uncharacterized protein n=1 Tax=Gymnopilus dilepis TaxID=231916 RepID=A0A409Y554_9AGAR|nr:hypothetical protein CVT26_003268 [Gymnopilus dilepis]